MLLVAALIASGAADARQDGQSGAVHAVVGTWRWDNDPSDPTAVTYAPVHADGAYEEVVGRDVGLGAWRATGPRSANVVAYFQDIDPADSAFNPGTIVVRQEVELDDAGRILSSHYTAEVRAADGSPAVHFGPFEATGTRVEVDAMGPSASSAPATPVP
jgi:hypothetical protein